MHFISRLCSIILVIWTFGPSQPPSELVLVKFKHWPPSTEQLEKVQAFSLQEYKRIPQLRIIQFRAEGEMPVPKIVARLKELTFVEYAEPQRVHTLSNEQNVAGQPQPPTEAPAILKAPLEPQINHTRVILKLRQSVQVEAAEAKLAELGLAMENYLPELRIEICRILGEQQVQAVLEACRNLPEVEYAEPDYMLYALEVPNDPDFSRLWGLHNTGQTGGKADADIDAPEAWDVQKGNQQVVVGVIDTGIEYDHPDLAPNMWRNPGEIPGNGQDDDGNGFVDDVFGWDFLNEDADPRDDNRHGTHVAGTIGAVGNNSRGVVGVCWQISLMALKFLSAQGSGATSDAIEAIVYAVNNGANILNNSWGGGGESRALRDAIEFAQNHGVLFVAAAGNEAKDNDRSPNYPSNYELENVVAVAASNDRDELAAFSNFGRTSVDLAAPGVNIFSTTIRHTYESLSGTSMATPHFAGAAALVWAHNLPENDWQKVKYQLFGAVDPVNELKGLMVLEGRLNLANAFTDKPLVAVLEKPASTVQPQDSLSLRCSAVAGDSVVSVMVHLQFSGRETGKDIIPARKVGKYLYFAILPSLEPGVTLRYQVEARDAQGRIGRSRVFEVKSEENGGGCGSTAAMGGVFFSRWPSPSLARAVAGLSSPGLFFFLLWTGWLLLRRCPIGQKRKPV